VKTLLRSTFIATPKDNPEHFLHNFSILRGASLGFEHQHDNIIWDYVKDFVAKHNHVPESETLCSYFKAVGEPDVVDRIEYLTTQKSLTRGDFETHLEQKVEERRKRQVAELLAESHNILTTGITLKNGKEEKMLRGPRDAVGYILDRSRDIVAPARGGKLSGSVTKDYAEVLSEYERVKNDPLAGKGQLCGLDQIDEALGGAKRGELWTHSAFTGGLKSTFMLNWCYNQCISGETVLVFSLEMPYSQVRRILYAMHSLHPMVRKRYKEETGRVMPLLDYSQVRDGALDEEGEIVLEWVAKDFGNPDNGYGEILIEVADPDKTDFTVADLRSKAELIYSKTPFSVIFVDHMGLMNPRKWVSSTTERQNEVIRDLKKLAMSFNRGAGIAVVGLYQINREGFKAAEKNGGTYNLTHLSYANECERSSDIVTATWVDDELRANNQVRFMCLKSRDDAPFEAFYAHVDWPQRRLSTLKDPNIRDAHKKGNEIDKMEDDILSDLV